MGRLIDEREITERVALCAPDGRLNPDAVGWSRVPLHDTDGIRPGRFWGRNKRWEYWAITTPTHLVSVTVSSLDYAGVHAFWVYDRATGELVERGATVPLARGVELPGTLGAGPVRADAGDLHIEIDELEGGTRLRATASGLELEVVAERPRGHEALGVVVPWSKRLFQYTVKDVARPARGHVTVGGQRFPIGADSWAVLDHGRGRWPYSIVWNWAAASGVVDGRVIGLQLGSKWTDGTGSTENAVVIDGRLHKISEELDWSYDVARPLAPWRMTGDSADLTFTPFWDKTSSTQLGVIATSGHQCFGHFDGWVLASGERVEVRGLLGWAEEIRNRW